MFIKQAMSRNLVCLLSTMSLVFFSALPAMAQETESTKVQTVEAAQSEPVKVKRSIRVSKANIGKGSRLSKLQTDIKQCGSACVMGGSGNIAAPGGTTRDYDCDENGNCHCFGAIDCVAMSEICAEGTLGCNDQGCVCTEGDG